MDRLLPKKRKDKFFNPLFNSSLAKNIKDFFLWKIGFYKSPPIEIPADFIYPHKIQPFNIANPYVVWINHSCFLINLGSGRFALTDPIWNKKCSPISFVGPKRRIDPPFPISLLPQIEFVIISHNHYDHLDKKSVLAIHENNPNCLFIVPLGVKKWFLKQNISNVVELNWWEAAEINECKIFATPAQHFSGRTFFDTDKTLWNGYVVQNPENEKKLYFAGDTGYNEKYFKEIGKRFNSVDLSLIPIGAYSPRSFMRPIHVNPEEAVKIHQDINSQKSIAMHFKTFHLSDEKFDTPPYELFLALKNANIGTDRFLVLDPGRYVNW